MAKKSAKKRGFKKIRKDGKNTQIAHRPRRRTKPNKRKPRKGGPAKAAVRIKAAAKKKPLRKKRASLRSSSAGRKARLPRRLKKAAKKANRTKRLKKLRGLLQEARQLRKDQTPASTVDEITGAGHHPGGVEDPDFDRRSDDELAKDLGFRDAEDMVGKIGAVDFDDDIVEGPDPEQPDAEMILDPGSEGIL